MALAVLVPQLNPALPGLTWVAQFNLGTGVCAVDHGPLVTVEPGAEPRWVCAGIWDGNYPDGNFHRAEHVFGSGIRAEGDEVHFVPASTTIDRLFWLRQADQVVVSNSLVTLLARVGARLSPSGNHRQWGEGICLGWRSYPTDVPVFGNTIELVRQHLYESLVIGPHGVRTVDRATPRSFDGYHDYLEALDGVLTRLWANANHPARPYTTRAVSTASRGYDSPAVTALVTKVTSVDCYSSAWSNTRIPRLVRKFMDTDVANDDGTPIAAHLGARPVRLSNDFVGLPAEFERWLWASADVSPELVFWELFADAEAAGGVTVWFAGTNGDGLWESLPEAQVLGGSLYRGAPSGVSLAEARVRFGVIDCSVPYLFARNVDSILDITRSPEMSDWRLGNDYDRPIPRRILEERGIPREWFGYGKKMVAGDLDAPQGAELRDEFYAASSWAPPTVSACRAVNLGIYGATRAYALARARGKRGDMLIQPLLSKSVLSDVVPKLGSRRATFVYCANTLADELAEALRPAP